MSEELKPCPFCGNKFPAVGYDSDMRALERPECITARCRQCGAETRKFSAPDRAVHAWNTRAAPKVKSLVWEDHPINGEPVLSMSETLFGTYFVCDDADDFSGLYLILVSHDNAEWWESVRATTTTLAERVCGDDFGPLKAAAQADYETRIISALEGMDA